jgi:hypothetical protein
MMQGRLQIATQRGMNVLLSIKEILAYIASDYNKKSWRPD